MATKTHRAQDSTHCPQDRTEGGAHCPQDGTEGGAHCSQDAYIANGIADGRLDAARRVTLREQTATDIDWRADEGVASGRPNVLVERYSPLGHPYSEEKQC